MFLVSFILVVIIIFVLPCILVNCRDYKYYPKIYKELQFRDFYRNGPQVYTHKFREKNDGFVWFIDQGNIKLIGNVYIFNSFMTYFDPYAFYWLRKYNRFLKHKLEIGVIQKY